MCLILVANPVYAAVVRNLPVESVMPVLFRAVALVLLGFAVLFYMMPGNKALSFCFAVYVGTISLFTTTTLNARLASLHSKAQAKRVYGIIAAGSQTGQLTSSLSAPVLFGLLGNLVVIPSAILYEVAVQLIIRRSRVPSSKPVEPAPAPAASASKEEVAKLKAKEVDKADEETVEDTACTRLSKGCDSAFGGFAILASTPFLRAITGHTLLITFLVAGIWYERASAVANAFNPEHAACVDLDGDLTNTTALPTCDAMRYDFFSTLNAIVGTLTLIVQTLCFSHVLRFLGFHGTLLAEPIALLCGLTVAILHPGLLSIAILDGLRKVVHYSLVKPTKEGLYAALPRDVVFIAKPLLDTLIYRMGSLVGAAYFTAAIGWGITPKLRQYLLFAVGIAWAANSYWLGVLAERHQREQEKSQDGEMI